ncbi:MAG: DUF4388 domain-containing protein, partial [Planctomycetota bacterium]|nr:DUF4388 domain-containing protein [Planctomycetota bacterium]
MSVRGALPFLDLAAFLAVAGFHRRSLVLRLTNAAGQGNLVLHEGRVVDALLGPARGVGALFPLSQGADSGSFELFPPPASPPEITITLPLGDILRRLAARSPAAALPANGWSIEGTTEYLSPLEIFQIFEINRRAAALRFWREDTALGEAIVVAGGLLQAAPPQGGAEALAAIFAGRPTRFAVSLLPQPPETAKRQALAPLLCEAIRRCAEVDSSSAAAAASDESEAILARLAKGEIEDFCRYFLAKRYLPGGRIAAPEIVARLCVDPLLEVRNLALATLETLPEGVVEAIAADPATPLPLLRYLLGVAGNPSWA